MVPVDRLPSAVGCTTKVCGNAAAMSAVMAALTVAEGAVDVD